MIDRQKAIEAFIRCGTPGACSDRCAYFSEGFNCYRAMKHDLLELLTEQPQTPLPVQKHGHWVFDPDGMDWNIPAWKCSECHCRNDNIPPNLERTNPLRWSGSKFCPNCGAKMDEKVMQDG